jgi:hypothetical protein
MSRLNNRETGAIVVVMQRVHLNDLTGYLLETSGDWEHLSLSAIAEEESVIPISDFRDWHRGAGSSLHPARESAKVLRELRAQLPPDVFSAQWQQRPVPRGGAMIQREWLRYYDTAPGRRPGIKIIQSWDTASKTGSNNAYSACTTWLQDGDKFYLLRAVRGRFNYVQLKRIAIELAQEHRPDWLLIEDASTGTSLAQELKPVSFGGATKLVKASTDKVTRLFVLRKNLPWARSCSRRELLFYRNWKPSCWRFRTVGTATWWIA